MAKLPPYTSTGEYVWHYTYRFICGLIFLFLIMPILIVLPLSFNVQPYFSFTPEMLALKPEAFSLRWYEDIFRNGMAAPDEPMSWAWFQIAGITANGCGPFAIASLLAFARHCCRQRLVHWRQLV